MKIDFYVDVDSHFLRSLGDTGVYATTKPWRTIFMPGDKRYKFTVDIPDYAIYGKVEYAPVTNAEEVIV